MNLKNSVGSATKFTDFLSEEATSTATLQLGTTPNSDRPCIW
jgi:hypothetical protein